MPSGFAKRGQGAMPSRIPENYDGGERGTNNWLSDTQCHTQSTESVRMPVYDFHSQYYPFAKKYVIIQIGLSYECSTSVIGRSPRVDKATELSSFSKCVMANIYI